MKHSGLFLLVLLGVIGAGLGARGVWGQEPTLDDTSSAVSAFPDDDGQEAPQMEALPPPSPDVMRPTRSGFRLTPGIMRLGARGWLREGPFSDVSFDPHQEDVLSERFGQRVMESANKYGEQGRDFLETFIECTLAGDGGGHLTPDMKQRFGQLGSELVPAMRDLIADFARDARPLLSDEQWEIFKEDLRREFHNVDRADRNLRRWANGGAGEDEGLDDLDLEGRNSRDGMDADGRPRASRILRNARRRADAEVRDSGPNSWRDFLASAKAYYKFDATQAAKGEELLAEYRHRAESVMTPQWRNRVRENRVKYNLRGVVREGVRPWLFHLENEYNELVAPLVEMGNEFRDKMIALSTPEQREAAVAKVRERAALHGLVFGELDEAILKLRSAE